MTAFKANIVEMAITKKKSTQIVPEKNKLGRKATNLGKCHEKLTTKIATWPLVFVLSDLKKDL